MMNFILCALVQNTVMGPTSPWRADSHVDYKTLFFLPNIL